MKITKLHIENFRAMKNSTISIDEFLTVIVGKNNTGKTSLKLVLDNFLNSNKPFSLDDFNTDSQVYLKNKIIEDKDKTDDDILKNEEFDFSIKLFIHIEYDENDNLKNISSLFTDLDDKNKYIALGFAFGLNNEKYLKLKKEYFSKKEEFNKEIHEGDIEFPDVLYFLKDKIGRYFDNKIFIAEKTISHETDLSDVASFSYKIPSNDNIIIISKEVVDKILNFQFISAERESINPNNNQGTRNNLSSLADKYWLKRKEEAITRGDTNILNNEIKLEKEFIQADKKFTEIYAESFKDILSEIKLLSDSKDSLIINSSLQQRNLLSNNAIINYSQENNINLPEFYNGLGYMNLVEIIFRLKLLVKNFEKEQIADINFLFIEEPEAHMHPQMQVIFIKKINDLLKLKNETYIQTIISTHSSHIVANTKIESFRYFLNLSQNGVVVKNLADLNPKLPKPPKKTNYTSSEQKAIEKYNAFKFVKQYITINRSEIFFADKIIIIEGDTERLFIPYFIQIIDKEFAEVEGYIPLSSQNISIIEVGAHSKVFKDLLELLQIKTLIITDIDFVNDNGHKCSFKDNAVKTSNSTIKEFITFDKLLELGNKTEEERIILNQKGLITFQQPEQIGTMEYWPRSFEDAFICLNIDWIKQIEDTSLFWKHAIKLSCTSLLKNSNDYYEIANNYIESKTSFAASLIYESTETLSSWKIPTYIKEGLIWLSK